jgi:hypothetical protein
VKYAAIQPSIRLQMVAHAMKRSEPMDMPPEPDNPPRSHRKANRRRGMAIGGPAAKRVKLNVLLDPSLVTRIKQSAIQHRTSLNKEVARLLEDSLK